MSCRTVRPRHHDLRRCSYRAATLVVSLVVGSCGTTPTTSAPEADGAPPGVVEVVAHHDVSAGAHDAVILIALGAESATSDGTALAEHVPLVSRGGTPCTGFAECRDLLRLGVDIDYVGRSGPLDLNGNGEPSSGRFAVRSSGHPDNPASATAALMDVDLASSMMVDYSLTARNRTGDGVLRLGALLPLTGGLSHLERPMRSGIEEAIEEVNRAGGVLGQPVELLIGDSGDSSSDIARSTVERMVAGGVDAIIGAASSALTLSVIDLVVAAGVVLFSPSNTDIRLSAFPHGGLFFRSAPSDALAAWAVAKVIASHDHASVAIVTSGDAYGTVMARVAAQAVSDLGIEVATTVVFDPRSTDPEPHIEQILAVRSSAIMLIATDAAPQVRALITVSAHTDGFRLYGFGDMMTNPFETAVGDSPRRVPKTN
jgi:ABC-type branched-subunit amino acid transport system substrate-binding protein